MSEWIGDLRFSAEVVAKLATKHNLSPEQVKEAVLCDAQDRDYWEDHPLYGRRLIVEGVDAQGTAIVAYLRPIDNDGLWRCLTAIRME